MEKEKLKKALLAIEPVLPAKPLDPVYENVLVERDRICASDGQTIWAEYDIDFPTANPILPHGKPFIETISKSVGDEFEVEINGSLLIKSGKKGRFDIPLYDGSVFVWPEFGEFKYVGTFPGSELKRCLGLVSACMKEEVTRPEMAWVFFHASEEPRIVGTDGSQIAVTYPNGELTEDLLIHPSSLAVVQTGEDVTFYKGESVVQMVVGQLTVYARLLESDYVAYDRMMHQPCGITLSGKKDSILATFKRIAPFVPGHGGVRISVGEDVEVKAENREYQREGTDVLEVEAEGEGEFFLNADIVARIVSKLAGDDISIEVTNDKRGLYLSDGYSRVFHRCPSILS